MANLTNSGDGPLEVPGFGSIPLDFQLPPEARFAHGLLDYRHTPRLTKREMAMLRLMQRITEHSGWDCAVLDSDEAQLTQWYRDATEEGEGLDGHLISATTWAWCLAELRDKAEKWRETSRLLVFDSSSAVCQADVLLESQNESLKEGVQEEIKRLVPHPQPRHYYRVVDPSLYPLVYDQSRVLIHGGRASLHNLWESTGEPPSGALPPHPLDFLRHRPRRLERRPGQGGPESCWSHRFQWLPCEVQFIDDADTLNLRITSYVNNLHPGKHQNLYRHLERLIASSVPSWNEILFYGNTCGCRPPRILTYGCEIHDFQEEHRLFNVLRPWPHWQRQCDTYKEWEALRDTAREYIQGPEPLKWKQAQPLPDKPANLTDLLTPEEWDMPNHVHLVARFKRIRRAWFNHPEPGVSFSYEQWKQGQSTGHTIHAQRISKTPDPLHHDHRPVQLERQFREKGLQVVVEIAHIKLTPDNPIYTGESHFHTERLRNNRITATSLYVVKCKNLTTAHLAFEHEDKVHAAELEYQVPEALATVLDVDYWEWYKEKPPRALHAFGSVPLPEGRLVSWPNTYQSRQEPFRLVDPSQPGNLTLIKLRLVDPHYRICSTQNVPPQQDDWWAAAARQAARLDQRLPPELVLSVMDHVKDWPMSAAEAEGLRTKLQFEHERVRWAIDSCAGHHIVVEFPYDEQEARVISELEMGVKAYASYGGRLRPSGK
ncbi:DUF4246 domain-containing protein [Aspergillus homomorphus CBS 101889]|uniref:Uncharacterized protein n=1 Tax=Aspergillus homomorphus (strain CBS 101889) TaxID=1450537 RepID=A0A395I7S4_ASPHC|nr:hypothetical protein BO97DRAFT_475578 [Aspergillus homomorphus CBS 101889]RAL16006.1 hypothetical protein BO97DRAFT_475578 [Aspergillus homomorphus CBS 101889]